MATITLTDKDGIRFDINAESITAVEPLGPLASLAFKARSRVTIDGIKSVFVKEEDFDVMTKVVMGVMQP